MPVVQSGEKSNSNLKATHKDPNAVLFWHPEGEFIGSTQKFHQLAEKPAKGAHILDLTDSREESSVCWFEVVDK